MIVKNIESGWEIIFQPAHGLLAGSIAHHLEEEHRSRFWFPTLTAITLHDDFKDDFRRLRKNYVTDLGVPKDFTLVEMDAKQRYEENRRRLTNAYRKHRWIGLLESKHIEFLYADQGVDRKLEKLIESEAAARGKHLRRLKANKSDLVYAYSVMRWCDRCSLILCQGRLPAMERRLEIAELRKRRYEIFQRDDATVCVEPWPFRDEQFELGVEVYSLPQLQFKDDKALKAAINECVPETRQWTFGRFA